MTTINSKFDFKIPAQLTSTLAKGRHALPDRGMGISSQVIKIEVKASLEEMTEASEARARQILGNKVDQVV